MARREALSPIRVPCALAHIPISCKIEAVAAQRKERHGMGPFGEFIEDRVATSGTRVLGNLAIRLGDRGPHRLLSFTTHRDDSLPKNSLCG